MAQKGYSQLSVKNEVKDALRRAKGLFEAETGKNATYSQVIATLIERAGIREKIEESAPVFGEKCDECDAFFGSEESLRIHKRNAH